MSLSKADIIAQLRRDILPLQGYKPAGNGMSSDMGLRFVREAFPSGVFPEGAVHEFMCTGAEDTSATCGFIAGIVSVLMQRSGISLWISPSVTIFPPALQMFGIEADKIIFITAPGEKERLWVVEEALKCEGLSAVIGEIQDLSFTASRRLQLAVEQSHVTGFLVRRNAKNLATTAVARWEITALPSVAPAELPGVGFPRWNVVLSKVRSGRPGEWEVEWTGNRFRHVVNTAAVVSVKPQRKAV